MDLSNYFPTHMDFQGQAKADNICRYIITIFGVVGFIWGYCIQQISQTIYILGAGFVLTVILTLPPWPMYRRHPLKWQSPVDDGPTQKAASKSTPTDGTTATHQRRKKK